MDTSQGPAAESTERNFDAGAVLDALDFVRASISGKSQPAPAGALAPLHNPWPGKRSLKGPPALQRAGAQDVSSRALAQAKQSVDMGFERHHRVYSDLRMSICMIERLLAYSQFEVGAPDGRAALVAAQYAQEGRADELERLILEHEVDRLLAALHAVDPERAQAVARRLLKKPKLWGPLKTRAYICMAEDPDALDLLLKAAQADRDEAAARGALIGLALRGGPEAAAAIEARVGGDEFGWSFESGDCCLSAAMPYISKLAPEGGLAEGGHSWSERLQARLRAGLSDPVGALIEASEAPLSREEAQAQIPKSGPQPGPGRKTRSGPWGRWEWAEVLSCCPPSEDNAAALAEAWLAGEAPIDVLGPIYRGTAQDKLPQLLSLEARRRVLNTDAEEVEYFWYRLHWPLSLGLARLDPAEVYELLSGTIEEDIHLQRLMLVQHQVPPGLPPWAWETLHRLFPRPHWIDWDPRWLKLGLDRRLPMVVAGSLGPKDREAARFVQDNLLSLQPGHRELTLGKLARIDAPERQGALVACVRDAVREDAGAEYYLRWARSWSDGPVLSALEAWIVANTDWARDLRDGPSESMRALINWNKVGDPSPWIEEASVELR